MKAIKRNLRVEMLGDRTLLSASSLAEPVAVLAGPADLAVSADASDPTAAAKDSPFLTVNASGLAPTANIEDVSGLQGGDAGPTGQNLVIGIEPRPGDPAPAFGRYPIKWGGVNLVGEDAAGIETGALEAGGAGSRDTDAVDAVFSGIGEDATGAGVKNALRRGGSDAADESTVGAAADSLTPVSSTPESVGLARKHVANIKQTPGT
jgi:hypothetical protein